MTTHNFKNWPSYSEEEISTVENVLRSGKVNYWTGTEGHAFENEFAEFCDSQHAIAVANGTLALELALRALNIGTGDEVIVTSRTFIASISCIVAVGAVPVFADVCPNSQNTTIDTIKPKVTSSTKAIIAVHLAGWPCDMDPILELALAHDIKVIEDCAQAHGAFYKNRSVGSMGHVSAWSFCQDKIMTTGGEGGMVTTNDKNLWDKMWSFKDHGKSWSTVFEKEHPPGFRWLHESFGSNYRLTEMQSAIGRIQIKKMSSWHDKRKQNAEAILSACEEFSELFRVPRPAAHEVHAWYKCYVFVRPENLQSGWDRDRFLNEICALGVPCFSGSCSEVYLEKAFEGTRYAPRNRLPVARELGDTSLMFLVHPTLSDGEIDNTLDAIRKVATLAMK